MRNGAPILGIIGGIIGMIVGFFGYGYTEVIARFGEVDGVAEQFDNVGVIRVMSFVAPLLAIAGAAMAKVRALWGGGLMLASAAGMYYAFGFAKLNNSLRKWNFWVFHCFQKYKTLVKIYATKSRMFCEKMMPQ